MNRVVITITVPCHAPAMRELGVLMDESLAGVRLSLERKDLIRRSIEETLGSMIRYSDHKGWRHPISVTSDVDESRIRMIIAEGARDFGQDVPEEDLSFRVSTTLARQVMSEISYTYKKGAQSELELVHPI